MNRSEELRVILTFPPEYDGELHFTVLRESSVTTVEHLQVSVTIAVEADETVLQTMRRLGQHLVQQPAKLVQGYGSPRSILEAKGREKGERQSRPPTPEEAFAAGASAMQSMIVAVLMTKGHMNLAPMVLSLKPPPFKMPERLDLEGDKNV